MREFKSICTDYVSDIDQLFHAPDPVEAPQSVAKIHEVAEGVRISRLRDGHSIKVSLSSDQTSLWEGF